MRRGGPTNNVLPEQLGLPNIQYVLRGKGNARTYKEKAVEYTEKERVQGNKEKMCSDAATTLSLSLSLSISISLPLIFLSSPSIVCEKCDCNNTRVRGTKASDDNRASFFFYPLKCLLINWLDLMRTDTSRYSRFSASVFSRADPAAGGQT